MADRIKGITIVIDGDTSKLSESLKDVNKAIKDTQSELRDVEKLLKMDPGNVELLTQKHQMLGKEVENTKEKLQKLKDAQAQMNAAGVDKSSAEYQALEREIIDCEQSLKKLEKAARESNVTLQKVAASGEKLKSAGSAITSVGKEVSKASAVVATGMTAAVKTTMDFDEEMSKVKAISGVTEEEFAKLRDTAREMGSTTKFSASESAEAFEYMAMAGWKAHDMIDGISGVLNLAAASGEELGTTSDIVTDSLTAFGLKAEDAAHFADVLAKASSNSNTNVSMMGETFKYAAPVAGAMGYKMEDVAIATGLMANSGIKATQAGTSLRSIMSRMADPTDDVAKAMDTLGISLDDGHGKMYSFMEIMQQMRQGFGQLKISEEELTASVTDLDSKLEDGTISQKEYDEAVEDLMERAYGAEGAMKAQAASMLAGKNALSGLLAIVNASDKDFNELTDAIYNADGTASDMAETMQDNLSGQLTILQSQLQELAISIGDTLMPTIRNIVEWLQKLVDKFNGMSDEQKKVIVVIGLIITALGPLLIIIGKVIFAIGTIMAYAPVIIGVLAPVVTAIGGFIVANIGIIAVIGLVIAAIVILIKNWEDIKTAAKLLGEIIVEKWDEIKEKTIELKDKVVEKWNEIKNSIIDKWTETKNNISEKWDEIKNKFKEGWEYIKGLFKQKLEFPKIKTPHFKVTGSMDLLNIPPKVPKISIDWYKKAYDDAYLLNSPTIFGASGGTLLGGGEGNGSEAVVGTDKLMSMMAEVVGNQNITVVLEGDAQGVFNLVRTENSRFMKSNGGYSPLMS